MGNCSRNSRLLARDSLVRGYVDRVWRCSGKGVWGERRRDVVYLVSYGPNNHIVVVFHCMKICRDIRFYNEISILKMKLFAKFEVISE